MYEVNEAFERVLAGPSRTMRAKLVYGDEVIDSGIKSIKIISQANPDNDTISIGGTVSAYAEITLYKQTHMVTGKEYTLHLGALLPDGTVEYCPMGLFTAQKPKEDDDTVTFTAYDRMVSKLEKPYFTQITKYPADGKQILGEIVQLSGVPFHGINELPSGVTVGWRTVYNDNNTTTATAPFAGYTYREALMYLAQMYGAFATISRTGAIEFRWYSNTIYKVPTNRSFDDIECAEQVYTLQKITCTAGENTLTAGSCTGATGITIENALMTQSVLNGVWQKIDGLTYLPTTLSFLGDPRIDLGDIVTVYRRDGTAIKVPVMSITQEFDGGLTTEIGSYGNTEESEDKAKGPTAKAIDRVYSELFLVKQVLADKISANYLEANYATITQLNAVEAKIDKIVTTEVTVAYLEANYAQLSYVDANFATIDLANVLDASIKTAMIDTGAVKSAQIADGSITDAKIVNLTANKINAGTLSVERLELIGSESSLIYALNNAGELVSQSVDTLDGTLLTDRTVTADKLVANSITANEIASKTITANEIVANTITTAELAAGSVTTVNLAAGSVTAEKISVTDLNALKAKIGGFTIGASFLANGTTIIGGAANSVYVGLDGISCGTNFIAKADGTVTVRGDIYCNGGLFLHHQGDEGTSAGYKKTMYFDTQYTYSGTRALIMTTGNGSGVQIADSLGVVYGLAASKAYIGDSSRSWNVQENQTYALQASSFLCDSWIRTTGQTGWYSETYGGGVFMRDSTYVQIYGGKKLYVGNSVEAKGAIQCPAIEISNGTPYIDFHYNASSADYTSRIIENSQGSLSVNGLDIHNDRMRSNSGHLIIEALSDSYVVYTGGSALYVTNRGHNGFVPVVASTFSVQSSKLAKENISFMSSEEAQKILNINVVDFDYKEQFGGNKGQHGVIAEEVISIIPSCVVAPEGYSEEEFDPEKGIQNKLLSVDYSKFVPYLIKMVQLQQAELDELKKHITNGK